MKKVIMIVVCILVVAIAIPVVTGLVVGTVESVKEIRNRNNSFSDDLRNELEVELKEKGCEDLIDIEDIHEISPEICYLRLTGSEDKNVVIEFIVHRDMSYYEHVKYYNELGEVIESYSSAGEDFIEAL